MTNVLNTFEVCTLSNANANIVTSLVKNFMKEDIMKSVCYLILSVNVILIMINFYVSVSSCLLCFCRKFHTDCNTSVK